MTEENPGQEIARTDDVGARIDAASADLNKLMAEAEELTEGLSDDPGTALVAARGASPAEIKTQMAEVRANVMKKRQQITIKQAELKSLLERKMSEVQAVMGP